MTHFLLYTERTVQTSSQAIVERGGSGRITCSYQWPVESVTWSRGDSYDQQTDIVTLNLTDGKATSGWGYDEGRFGVADDFSLLIQAYRCRRRRNVLLHSY